MGKITVLRAGPLTTVQDLGRDRHRAQGISSGGALDLFSAQITNLIVGNPADAALLEVSLGGTRLRFDEARKVAWCGGNFEVKIAGTSIPPGRLAVVRPSEELTIGASARGARAWLAFGGGIDVPVILGSRSTDLRGGFGGFNGRTLRADDELSLGEAAPIAAKTARVAPWSAPSEWAHTATRSPILRVIPGAEWEMFSENTHGTFLQSSFTVTAQADRMGVRLQGEKLPRKNKTELLSEAVTPGTVQVAHDGQPILLLGDCQTIGGYPKIAHVITVDLGRAAQLQPNDIVRFAEVTFAQARALFRARMRDLAIFRAGLALRES